MTYYSSVAVSVSPKAAEAFIQVLRSLEHEEPDLVTRADDGTINALWQDRNHFDPQSGNSDFSKLERFFDETDPMKYIVEILDEYERCEVWGNYVFGFSRRNVYNLDGKRFDYDRAVASKNMRLSGKLVMRGRCQKCGRTARIKACNGRYLCRDCVKIVRGGKC